MKNPEDTRAAFEAFYVKKNCVRKGARGRASRHLDQHEGEYISDHAAECWSVWVEACGWVANYNE